MRILVSYFILFGIKIFANTFYRFEVKWLSSYRENWKNIRLIVFLNHTSLYEPLYIGVLPFRFIAKLAKKLVAPGASKTMNRPLVGKFWRFMSPGIVSITRKRDMSWRKFMDKISKDSIVIIAAEGRMKRRTGLDSSGHKMTVRSGVSDILEFEEEGDMLIAYSGGLHHIQAPGERIPKLFKLIKMNLELVNIKEYKARFKSVGTQWKRDVTEDLQTKLENNCPKF